VCPHVWRWNAVAAGLQQFRSASIVTVLAQSGSPAQRVIDKDGLYSSIDGHCSYQADGNRLLTVCRTTTAFASATGHRRSTRLRRRRLGAQRQRGTPDTPAPSHEQTTTIAIATAAKTAHTPPTMAAMPPMREPLEGSVCVAEEACTRIASSAPSAGTMVMSRKESITIAASIPVAAGKARCSGLADNPTLPEIPVPAERRADDAAIAALAWEAESNGPAIVLLDSMSAIVKVTAGSATLRAGPSWVVDSNCVLAPSRRPSH